MDTQDKPKKKWYKRWWAYVLYVIILLSVLSSVGSSKNTEQAATSGSSPAVAQQPKEAIKVTALELSTAYKDNEVAADQQYKGKTVEVSGTVDTIGKDILDTPYIAFAGEQYAIIDRVQCMFSKSDESQLATVKKGQKITLRGEVSGKMGNVIVNGCSIVQ